MQTMRDVYLLHLHVRLPNLLEEVKILKFGFDTIDESAMCVQYLAGACEFYRSS